MKLEGLNSSIDLRNHLKHYAADNVLRKIYYALPESQRKEFLEYRKNWVACDHDRIDLSYPLCVSLELVANCNLKCAHCVRNIPEWKEKAPSLFNKVRMGFETFKKIVDECKANHLPSLWLGCSGEALLEKDIIQMISYAHKCGIMDLILTTNGTLLTKETIDQLLKIPITRINISVDAFTPETYKKMRGGDLVKLVSNIKYIIQKRGKLPIVRLTFIDAAQNCHEREAFINYWRPRVDLVDIQKFIDLRNGKQKKDCVPFHCSAPWRIIDIQANGDLVPCNSFFAIPNLIMGNIHTQSISKIWNSKKFKMFRNGLKRGNYTSQCKECFRA